MRESPRFRNSMTMRAASAQAICIAISSISTLNSFRISAARDARRMRNSCKHSFEDSARKSVEGAGHGFMGMNLSEREVRSHKG